MIPNLKDRQVSSSGVAASGAFGISAKDSAHIMTILRDTLYSDKVLAVLREYSSNAWDAHRDVGKHDLPIKITIPTSMNPVLVIRDYGPGLSQDDVFQVYTQYGSSTKRNSNSSVGMLGIGSKSGFAYSDSFSITSWHGGKKKMYVAVLDASEEGVINLLHEEDCGVDETGVEVQMAVRPPDIMEFMSKARKLFQYFDPRPEINLDLPPAPSRQTKLKHGTLIEDRVGEDGNHQWVAVMGCVPYRINLDQVQKQNNGGVGVADYINRISGALYFDIGEVQISASREELKYSEMTKKALIQKFSLVVDEFVEHTLDNIDKGGFTFWERRVRAQVLTALHLPIPKNCKDIVQDYIKLKTLPRKSVIAQNGAVIAGISISSRARMLLRDTTHTLQGYNLSHGDYVVTPNLNQPLDEVKKELEELLTKYGLDGMPIQNLSELTWYAPPKKGGNKKANKKHSVSCFKMVKQDGFYSPYSEIWEPVDREPQKDDIFVIISKFKGHGYNFYEKFREDQKLAKFLGGTMPTIYGYKWTMKVPIDATSCVGTEYRDWRDPFIKSLFTKRIGKLFNYWEWAHAADDSNNHSPSEKNYQAVKAALGASHPIAKLFKKQQDGRRATKNMKYEANHAMEELRGRLFGGTNSRVTEFKAQFDAIIEKYPLLKIYDLDVLWHSHSKEWVEYIKLIDNQ
jgi:hypothetical protein